MGKNYREGRYLVVCDITGQEVWDDEVRRQWDGAIVRKKSWSPQHPQERIRPRPERQISHPVRPAPDPTYVAIADEIFLLENSPSDEFWGILLESSGGLLALE